ncbi:MAG: hypothetical protein WKG32_18210 [Gemmatimonadaceae bacterium]
MTTPDRTLRGLGDRWLAGERVADVAFGHHERVRIATGPLAGAEGLVALLLGLTPEPIYLVTLGPTAGDARVRQADLRPAV